ncbi:carboxypeptidase-like regulatory domain-containing protein [Blastopirellula marina]|uniref:Carboxypeptidase regulatory-like domain-containing protein n=1 Tax=Blastopirellula marina DSM 3645 TaxID=314230 RepID=A3ZZN2_9BACT|nr:carboxypeptidase-like regulatory domain-containing protein [Blastopirellula marina]EAQ78047.1 hypothetical protein DSM3645_16405 [Blastopirellula marina DSM 3645]
MKSSSKSFEILSAAVLCFFLPGCFGGGGPPTGHVVGVVLDSGQPIANAEVAFFPQVEGRVSYGSTDEQGRFELTYSDDIQGAVVGEHRVKISTSGSAPQRESASAPNYRALARPMKRAGPQTWNWPETVSVLAGENELTFEVADIQ